MAAGLVCSIYLSLSLSFNRSLSLLSLSHYAYLLVNTLVYMIAFDLLLYDHRAKSAALMMISMLDAVC
jgi:hypothetical protein